MKQQRHIINFVFLFICLLWNSALYAQPSLKWAKMNDGTWGDEAMGVAADKQGNVFTIGYFFMETVFNVGGSNVSLTTAGGMGSIGMVMDGFVTKQDAAGNFLWAKQFAGSDATSGGSGTTPTAITTDDSGNVYVMGYFGGTVDFDPGPNDLIFVNVSPHLNIFIVKLDTQGDLVWGKQFESIVSGSTYPWGIVVDDSGNVYTTGRLGGTMDFDPGTTTFNLASIGSSGDAYVSKLDASGNFVWARQMGGASTGSAQGRAIALDNAGHVYVTGSFNNSVDFDPGGPNSTTLTTNGTSDIFVTKLGIGSGELVWVKQFEGKATSGGNNSNMANGIATDPWGNIYIGGDFYDTTTFGPGAGAVTFVSQQQMDGFIAKLATSGDVLWAKQIGGAKYNGVNNVKVDAWGNVHAFGWFQDTADFDPGPGTFKLAPQKSGQDLFVNKLNTDGDFEWAVQISGSNSLSPVACGFDLGPSSIYINGDFMDTLDADPGTGTVNLISKYNSMFAMTASNIFVIELDNCTSVSGATVAITGSDTICAGGSYTYVVPVVPGAVSYTWQLPSGWTGSSTTDSITVVAGNTGGDITVIPNGLCDTGSIETLPVYVNVISVSIDVSNDTLAVEGNGYTTYQWYMGEDSIGGATGHFHIATENGDYYVVVTDRYGCTDTSDIYPINNLSVPGAVGTPGLAVYPNPAKHTVHIHTPIPASIQLNSIEGKNLTQQVVTTPGTDTPIDISVLPAGIYILSITDLQGGLLHIEKLVKE